MDSIDLTREERELLESVSIQPTQNPRDLTGGRDLTRHDSPPLSPLDTQRQLEVVEAFHQDVAARFGDALSRGLQRLIEVHLVDVQCMTYSQFAFSRAKPTCYMVLQATPLPASLALELTPALLYPVLDALLGGGKHACPPPDRAPTPLEQRLAQRVVRLLLDELHDAWEPLLAVNLSIDRVESDAQRVRVVAPGDDVLVLSFNVRVSEQIGPFSLCLPLRAIRQIVDKLLVGEFTGTEGATLQSPVPGADTLEIMAYFPAESVSPFEIDQLREGDVLLTEIDAEEGLAQVNIDGRLAFEARPGAMQGRRAIVLGSKLA